MESVCFRGWVPPSEPHRISLGAPSPDLRFPHAANATLRIDKFYKSVCSGNWIFCSKQAIRNVNIGLISTDVVRIAQGALFPFNACEPSAEAAVQSEKKVSSYVLHLEGDFLSSSVSHTLRLVCFNLRLFHAEYAVRCVPVQLNGGSRFSVRDTPSVKQARSTTKLLLWQLVCVI